MRLWFPVALTLCGCNSNSIALVLEGQVQNYDDQLGVPGATLTVTSQGGEVAGSGETFSDGSFSFTVAVPYEDAAILDAIIEHPDFETVALHDEIPILNPEDMRIRVVPGHVLTPQNVTLSAIPMAPRSDAPGTISGLVFDALQQDQVGLPGLTVNIMEGMGTPKDATPIASALTTADGIYTVDALPAGTYSAWIEGDTAFLDAGFTVVSLGGEIADGQSGGTTASIPEGWWRAVLTWGESPADLDSHTTGPDTDAADFHIWFSNKSYPTGSTPEQATAFLDVDDVTSYGPETTTIRGMRDGWYRFTVHDFTNLASTTSSFMSNSRARVQLFVGQEYYRSFEVPTGRAGNEWTVFDLDGSDGTPYLVNQFYFTSDYANDPRLFADGTAP